jgi:cytochrome c5
MFHRSTAIATCAFASILLAACGDSSSKPSDARPGDGSSAGDAATTPVDPVVMTAQAMITAGRQTFRFDTFGDEAFWGGQLQMHLGIAGAANGGVGPGVTPMQALALGLKVDMDALPAAVVTGIQNSTISLTDPATTIALLKLDAVVGVKGVFDGNGKLTSVGIQCALCHSTVDDAFAPGVGHRLDGWANRDLNVGAIVAGTAQSVQPVIALFANAGVTLTAQQVAGILNSWGPGKFDAEVFLDGKATPPAGNGSAGAAGPGGTDAATLIPPAFNLAGVNQHTWTGWGSITYWNAFVANLEMHGQGNFTDSRLANAAKFPVAAANHLDHVTSETDLISPKLPALEFYQLAIASPPPPTGSFDAAAAARGKVAFEEYHCTSCHTGGITSDPGWNMHTPAEMGEDAFQANRSPDGMYRTAPLNGLWTHTKGGFFHDGRFATLGAVLDHYASNGIGNGGTPFTFDDTDKADLEQYLLSL